MVEAPVEQALRASYPSGHSAPVRCHGEVRNAAAPALSPVLPDWQAPIRSIGFPLPLVSKQKQQAMRTRQRPIPCQSRRKRRFALYLLASVLVSQTIVLAADTDAGLEEIVVTARKRPETLQNVPDSVSVLTEKDVESARIQGVPDALRLLPSVTFIDSQDAGLATISIRGVGQVRNGQPPVAIVIDGVQVASPDQIKQTLDDVAQIEVLKGPQGALYGRNAIGGAIVITTKKPGDTLGGYVQAGAGNGGLQEYDVDLNGPTGIEHLKFRVDADYQSFAGVIDNVTLNHKVDFFTDKTVRAGLLWQPGEALEFDLAGGWSDHFGGASWYIPIGDGDPNNLTAPVQANLLGYSERRVRDGSLRALYTTDFGAVQSVTSASKVDVTLFESLLWTPDAPYGATQDRGSSDWNEDLRFSSGSDQRARWVVGGFFQHTDSDLGTTLLVLPTPFFQIHVANTTTESRASAGYGQLSYDILEQLELTGSVRYDRDSQSLNDLLTPGPLRTAVFSAWQPKGSLSYKIGGAMVYATAATGFRSGGFNPPNSGFPNTYPAESTRNIEVGAKTTFLQDRLRLDGSLFQNHYDNQQTFILNGANQGIVPIARSTIKGAEIDLQAKPVAELQVGISLSYLDGVIDDYNGTALYVGNRVPLTYRFSAAVNAQYEKSLGPGRIGFRLDYTRHSGNYWFVDNADKQSAVDLVNARASYRFGQWETALWARNLLNKRYTEEFFAKEYLGEPQDIRYPGTPRLYGLTVRYRF